MKITVGKFIIKNSEGSHLFDLYKAIPLKSGKVVEKGYSYGVSFDRACRIITEQAAEEEIGEVNLTQYIAEYKELIENFSAKLIEILKQHNEDLKASSLK